MKKLFIDTNIVIDLVSRREPFYDESAEILKRIDVNLKYSSQPI